MQFPEWGLQLIEEVCRTEGVVPPAKITAVAAPGKPYTTGRTWGKPRMTRRWGFDQERKIRLRIEEPYTGPDTSRIHLSIGTGGPEVSTKVVLLHELAHHICNRRPELRGDHHNAAFWRVAWKLYVRYGVTDAALGSEVRYRKEAAWVAMELGIEGARETLNAIERQRQSFVPVAARSSTLAERNLSVGARVEMVGMAEQWNGLRAVIVRFNVTRAVVRLEEARGRFPAGAQVTAPIQCLRRI